MQGMKHQCCFFAGKERGAMSFAGWLVVVFVSHLTNRVLNEGEASARNMLALKRGVQGLGLGNLSQSSLHY